MENDQEKAYEVKDKRRFNADGTMKEESAATSECSCGQSHEHTQKNSDTADTSKKADSSKKEENVPPPDVYSMLNFMMGMLAEQAWTFMGIRLAPGQKEANKDMVQAKIAIDTIAFIADKIQPHLSDEDKKAVRGAVSDLQMNYVMHNK